MQKLINGRRVGDRYVLLERIGSGGHGEIWRVYDEHEVRELALKILHPAIAGSPEAWTALQHEFLMVNRLSHPGILRTDAPVRDGELAALPMEFAGAGDLRRLRGQSYLRIVPVLVRIAEVLEHAHQRGVVHRDLKPGNVLFDAQGRVRLADFGAAGLAGSNHVLAAGSPFSASPQQLRNECAAPADDIYGLGALAYELLAGHPPFYPDFDLQRVLYEAPAAPATTHPAPVRLVQLVMAMLAKDPRERPAMATVIEKLNATLADSLGAREDEINTLLLPVNGSLGDVAGAELTAELEVLDLATTLPAHPISAAPVVAPAITERPKPAGAAPLDIAKALPAAASSVASPLDDAPRVRYRAAPPALPRSSRRRARRRRRLAWLAGATAVALVLIIAIPYLARWLDSASRVTPVLVAEPAAMPDSRAMIADSAELLRNERDAFSGALAALEKRQAALWASKGFAAAKSAGEAAERLAEAGDMGGATRGYAAASGALKEVAAEAEVVLQRELASGNAALAAGNPPLARQAFERAIRIDPDSADAQRGVRESAALDNALARMSDAARAEQAGDRAWALTQYEQATRLAPKFAPAMEARNRLRSDGGDDEHARAIAKGTQALQEGKLVSASADFERAQQLRPSSPAARDGIARVQAALSTEDFEVQRRTAAALEEQERWRDAAEDYKRLLDADPTLAFARAGHDRSIARAELGDRLDSLIAQPERLGANAVYADALNALERASEITAQGPVLRSQVTRLQILLEDFNRRSRSSPTTAPATPSPASARSAASCDAKSRCDLVDVR